MSELITVLIFAGLVFIPYFIGLIGFKLTKDECLPSKAEIWLGGWLISHILFLIVIAFLAINYAVKLSL